MSWLPVPQTQGFAITRLCFAYVLFVNEKLHERQTFALCLKMQLLEDSCGQKEGWCGFDKSDLTVDDA